MSSLSNADIDVLCLLFEEYSKKSIFQLNEYADVAKIHTKLKNIKDDQQPDKIEDLDLSEYIYLVKMFQIVSLRYCTPIQNWKPILTLYEKLMTITQELDRLKKEKKLEPIQEELKDNIEVNEVN